MDAQVERLCSSFVQLTEREPFLSLSEGFMTDRGRALARLGRAGRRAPLRTRRLPTTCLVGGEVVWKRRPRVAKLSTGSCDFTVAAAGIVFGRDMSVA